MGTENSDRGFYARAFDPPHRVLDDLHDLSWSTHLDQDRFDALLDGRMTITLTIREALRTVTAVLHHIDGDRFTPVDIHRQTVSMYFIRPR